MDALRTALADRLGIRHALLLAGMAGGPNTPELVGAVSRAGGLGVLGVTGTTVDGTTQAVAAAVRAAGGAPVGVNVQLAPPGEPTGERQAILAVLAPFRAELGLPAEPPAPVEPDPPLALLEAALAAGARVVTTWHDPAPALSVAAAHDVPVLAMTTRVGEARHAVAVGAAAVIAQGGEAGGHRSSFTPGERPPETGTLAFVPQLVDALGDVPVVASGGIGDGRGIAAALLAGAGGVSIGTRFLAAEEAGVAPVYRAALAACPPDGTVVTDLVTGRPARWIRNRLIDALIAADAGHLGWLRQGPLTSDLRAAAAAQGRADIMPMLAGQSAALATPVEPAAAIVERLLAETAAALARVR